MNETDSGTPIAQDASGQDSLAHAATPSPALDPSRWREVHRLACLGRLAGGLVHEINNPTTLVMLAVSQIEKAAMQAKSQQQCPALETVSQLAGEIAESTKQIRAVVNDYHLLAGAMGETVSGSFDLARMIRAAVGLATVAYRIRTPIALHLGELPACPGSYASLVTVVVDLLANAWLAIPPDEARAHNIEVHAHNEDSHVVLLFRDDGCGMPPHVLERAFEPFFTTRTDGSAGLGLTAAREAVSRLNGRIRIDSTPGKGTLVEIVLPL